MKLLEHFASLVRTVGSDRMTALTMSTAELADVFCCSPRNVKLIIHSMTDLDWISWESGRGRGNKSTLTVHANLEELVLEEAKTVAKQHSFEEALNTLKSFHLDESYRAEFLQWFFTSFDSRQMGAAAGEHLSFPSYRPLPSLDPAFVDRRTENHMMRHIFDTLVRYDEGTGKHVPHLAHAWETNEEHTVWRFYLRKGVLFHHGTEMTGEDVVYSFERLRHPHSPYRWFLRHVKKCVQLNRYSVTFELAQPCSFFLHLLVSLGASIVPVHLGGRGNFANLPIGTGPFQVKQNDEHKFTMEAFASYFDKRPHLDGVDLYFFPHLYEQQRWNEFADDEQVNFFHYQYPDEKEAYVKTSVMDRGSKVLTMNLRKFGVGCDEWLRCAIDRALDREKLIEDLGGNRSVAAGTFLEGAPFEQSSLGDEQSVQECLRKSHYNGEVLSLVTYQGAGNERDAAWIQERLAECGIRVAVTAYPLEELVEGEQIMEQADFLLAEQLSHEDPLLTYLSVFLGEKSVIARHMAEVDRDKCREIVDKDAEALLEQFHQVEISLREQRAFLSLYRLEQFAFYQPDLQGVTINALGWVDYTKMWFKQAPVEQQIPNSLASKTSPESRNR